MKTAMAGRDLERRSGHRGHTFPSQEYHLLLDAEAAGKMQGARGYPPGVLGGVSTCRTATCDGNNILD